MQATNFGMVPQDAYFIFEDMLMMKRKGWAVPAKTPRHPVDYNAIDTKTGDYWEMDETDEVYLIVDDKESE